ncbi:MAG: hypothetical protein CMB11_06320 [Euryarchaeota archaeon]|nr:hypothetical protein [Euryarchaeota archaeon]
MELAAGQHLVRRALDVAADRAVKREVVALVDGAARRANDVVALAIAAELVPVDGAGVRLALERLPDAREVASAAALGSAAVREVP